MLWSNKKEDLMERMPRGRNEKIEKNGVYELKINEAYLTNSNQSKAVGVTFVTENDEGNARFTLWHKKGDGTENIFAQKLLNRLCFLLKLKVDELQTEKRVIKGFKGDFERTFLPAFENKEIGVILEVEKEGDTINYSVKDFYDIKTSKTANEITNKEEATDVDFWRSKWAEIKEEAPKQVEESVDEFPF